MRIQCRLFKTLWMADTEVRAKTRHIEILKRLQQQEAEDFITPGPENVWERTNFTGSRKDPVDIKLKQL